ALVEAYATGVERIRREHKPALFHINELTQPQGHSTSGSHERYKSKERLRYEKEFDCVLRMRDWIIESGIASESQLDGWGAADKEAVEAARDLAWEAFQSPIRDERDRLVGLLRHADSSEGAPPDDTPSESPNGTRSMVLSTAIQALNELRGSDTPERSELARFVKGYQL